MIFLGVLWGCVLISLYESIKPIASHSTCCIAAFFGIAGAHELTKKLLCAEYFTFW